MIFLKLMLLQFACGMVMPSPNPDIFMTEFFEGMGAVRMSFEREFAPEGAACHGYEWRRDKAHERMRLGLGLGGVARSSAGVERL